MLECMIILETIYKGTTIVVLKILYGVKQHNCIVLQHRWSILLTELMAIYRVVEYTKNGQYFRYTRCIKLAFSDFDFKIIILNWHSHVYTKLRSSVCIYTLIGQIFIDKCGCICSN